MSNLDEALERFQMGGLEYGIGFSNHGPMAAEALVALGHESLIPNLVDVYAARLPDFEAGRPIAVAERGALLGRRDQAADWIASFEEELQGDGWQAVLARWLPALLPGYFAAGTHGPLRTAHAVRGLEAADTALRRRELAFGLGYWAGYYQALPGSPGARPAAGQGPAKTLARVEPLESGARHDGLLSEAVRALDESPAFVHAVECTDLTVASPDELVSELCISAARLYLEHPEARIAYAHAVTSASALRMLLPCLAPPARPRAVGFALQAAAALHATHGGSAPPGEPVGVRAGAGGPTSSDAARSGGSSDAAALGSEVRRVAESIDEIRYRAACSVEEHAIKLAEACLREYAIREDPVLRLAAADASLEIGASHGGRGG